MNRRIITIHVEIMDKFECGDELLCERLEDAVNKSVDYKRWEFPTELLRHALFQVVRSVIGLDNDPLITAVVVDKVETVGKINSLKSGVSERD